MPNVPGFSEAELLLQRVQRYIDSSEAVALALCRIRGVLSERKCRGVFFGGLLRDAFLSPGLIEPRDIDLVVETDHFGELEKDFQEWIYRRTRFGGLVLEIAGVKLDIWPLTGTWGFTANLVQPASFANLPATALLSIEAVTLNLDSLQTGSPIVHEKKFFESTAKRIIDLNLGVNPFPSLSIVRTLIVAAKYDMQLSRSLASFLLEQRKVVPRQELELVQQNHYGQLIQSSSYIDEVLQSLQIQLQSGPLDGLAPKPLSALS